MTTLDPTGTLADLITARPGLEPILDRMGPDWCCGGQRRLVEADTHLHVHKEHNLLFPAVLEAERRVATR